MSKTNNNQRLLNWLESEKKKDEVSEKIHKEKLIQEFKNLKKEDIFKTKQKLTIWQRIKKTVLGI